MKVDVEKLIAILTELGVEEEKIQAAVDALTADQSKEESDPEAKPEEESNPDEAPKDVVESEGEPSAPVEEEVPGDLPQDGKEPVAASVPPVEGEPIPEEVPPIDAVPPVGDVPPEDAGVVPPVDIPPVVSLEEFNQVKGDLEETKKANEALLTRIESLEEALKAAGVIEGQAKTQVGGSSVPPDGAQMDTTMDDILAEINRKY